MRLEIRDYVVGALVNLVELDSVGFRDLSAYLRKVPPSPATIAGISATPARKLRYFIIREAKCL